MTDRTANVVKTAAELAPVRAAVVRAIKQGELIGFDVETDGPAIVKPGDKRKKPATKPDALRHHVVGYCITVGREGWYVDVRHAWRASPFAEGLRFLRFMLQPNARVVAHNAPFEIQVLRNEGLVPRCQWKDSMLGAWMRGMRLPKPAGLKLKPLMTHYYNQRRPGLDDILQGRQVSACAPEEIADYCIADGRDAVTLWSRCWGEMSEPERRDYLQLEAPTLEVARHMVEVGVTLDRPLLVAVAENAKTRMAALRDKFLALTETDVVQMVPTRQPKACVCIDWARKLEVDLNGNLKSFTCGTPGCVNGYLRYKNGNPKMHTVPVPQRVRQGCEIGSATQLSRWMWRELKWWPAKHPKTKTGDYVTKSDFLKPLVTLPGKAGDAARMVVEYRALMKYTGQYTHDMIAWADQYADRRIHTAYLQTGTNTGRFSSAAPNISNLPTGYKAKAAGVECIRAAFVAPDPDWDVVIRDLSQAELRMLAHFSQDPVLLRVYREGGDVHGELMVELGIDNRVAAKTTNFATIYRISARSLAVKLTVATGQRYTPAQAARFIAAFYRRFARVEWYHEQAIERARRRGYAQTLGGFRAPLPESEWVSRRHYTENRAINYPIQGGVGTLLKRCLTQLYTKWDGEGILGVPGRDAHARVAIQGQTYDEVIVLARKDFSEQANEDMRVVMANCAPELTVPMVSDGGVGPNWAEAKS